MQHLVRFRTADGRDGHHVAGSLEEALQFVEHLRNSQGADEARLYRLHEVPIEFRTYYKVEVRTGGEGEDLAMPTPPAVGAEPPTTTGPVAVVPAVAAPAGGGGPALVGAAGRSVVAATDPGLAVVTPVGPVADASPVEANGRRLFTRS